MWVCAQCQGIFCKFLHASVMSDTWMGKYSDFPSQTPLSETKFFNFHLKARRRDYENPRHFYMGVPPPRGGKNPRPPAAVTTRADLLRDSDSVTQLCTVYLLHWWRASVFSMNGFFTRFELFFTHIYTVTGIFDCLFRSVTKLLPSMERILWN